MSERVIGPHGPFLPEDIERIKTVYKTLPTYTAEDESIGISEFAELCKQVGWPRTDEQILSYQDGFRRVYEGRVPLAVLIPIVEVLHTPMNFVKTITNACDKNQDGLIQKDEYDMLFRVLQLHYPEWELSYEQFVKEADTDDDGNVCVEEGVTWIEKWVAERRAVQDNQS